MSDWRVNAYSEKWLRRGFQWVYPKEIVSGRPSIGAPVRLLGHGGAVLGRGLADKGWIAARVYRHDDGPLDEAWMERVVGRAADLRDVLVGDDTTAFRLINGENDGLPGIRVDRWGHFLVIAADSPAVGPLLSPLCDALERRLSPRGIYLCYRPDGRDGRDPAGFRPAPGLLRGRDAAGAVRVRERGLCFDVYPAEGPDVGLYTDMRDLRAWLEPHWGGARVLNTFAFTGAFSVAAAFGGATEVVSVDLSQKYLDRARDNFRANALDPGQHSFIADDVFKALDRFRRKGERFERVILDPPAFSHGSKVWSAKRDYPRLVSAACAVLEDGGWIIVASNQGELSPHQFRGFVAEGLRRGGCSGQLLHSGTQAGDVPASTTFPEGQYLKLAVYRVLRG
ncbi:MAG: 23S rRNA (cytosine1962-C5)-methyltransferase [Myxococcota bacterium]